MTVRLHELVSFLDTTLEIDRFRDYGPNGLQVEGASEVNVVVTGVSANARLLERAIAINADVVIVHHGLIWGAGITQVVGPAATRLRAVLANHMSLLAYHLPLDAHPRLGNNAGLADAIGLGPSREHFGDVRGHALGWCGQLAAPTERSEVLERISQAVLGGGPLQFVFPHGPDPVAKVGLCTGAASDLVEQAAQAGCDLYLTGELNERSAELARELDINLVAAGHYATEVFGPRRIADELSRVFAGLIVEFIDVPVPV